MQIGSLQLWPKGNGVIELTNMHVQRDYRCQGAGKMLMNAALQCARTQGFSTVRLAASPFDGEMTVQALTAMYQRMGFQAAGVPGRGHPVMQQNVTAAVPFVPVWCLERFSIGLRGPTLRAKWMYASSGLSQTTSSGTPTRSVQKTKPKSNACGSITGFSSVRTIHRR
jgi:predicted GNAT family acetyltransferase